MQGHTVVGIDLADSGIRIARESYPGIRFEQLPADQMILDRLGEEPFDLVYSSEVIEHLYEPRSFMAGCHTATRRGGGCIISTPYHGYLKNLALSVADKWDHHHDPLYDGGHIKFFSRKTLSRLMIETGFTDLRFQGAGRLPYLWASMLIFGHKS
jgi:2-polyprenyl-6-hydroxyphenyl methylase/3-demethylubiquinone-9 3-methyltransferase